MQAKSTVVMMAHHGCKEAQMSETAHYTCKLAKVDSVRNRGSKYVNSFTLKHKHGIDNRGTCAPCKPDCKGGTCGSVHMEYRQ